MTVTLDDAMHQALKETEASQGRSIGKIIEEGLILRGIKPVSTARDLLSKARLTSSIAEKDAMDLAAGEVHAERKS